MNVTPAEFDLQQTEFNMVKMYKTIKKSIKLIVESKEEFDSLEQTAC